MEFWGIIVPCECHAFVWQGRRGESGRAAAQGLPGRAGPKGEPGNMGPLGEKGESAASCEHQPAH